MVHNHVTISQEGKKKNPVGDGRLFMLRYRKSDDEAITIEIFAAVHGPTYAVVLYVRRAAFCGWRYQRARERELEGYWIYVHPFDRCWLPWPTTSCMSSHMKPLGQTRHRVNTKCLSSGNSSSWVRLDIIRKPLQNDNLARHLPASATIAAGNIPSHKTFSIIRNLHLLPW